MHDLGSPDWDPENTSRSTWRFLLPSVLRLVFALSLLIAAIVLSLDMYRALYQTTPPDLEATYQLLPKIFIIGIITSIGAVYQFRLIRRMNQEDELE